MTEHVRGQSPQPRRIESLQQEELDHFYAVPGWRIWSRSIFSRGEYREAFEQAAAKPLAIMVAPDRPGYQRLWDRQEINQTAKIPSFFRGSGTFDRPSFLLEPLTGEEVQRIDEVGETSGPVGSIDKSNEIFRPGDLRKIFER